ncbi:MAG: hypothetical protein JSW28_09710 [Thermoplasmata archaeon]|nr:MAG: hypothetical protein JSW28_09710 [Thermoplasmata archaeon]
MKSKLIVVTAIIAFLLSSAFVSPSGTRAQYGILLQCQSREHYVEVEQYTYYHITVTNTGESADTYNVTSDPPPEFWQAELSTSEISVPAGEEETVLLKVKTTCECEFGDRASINVTATSLSDPGVLDRIQTITTFATAKVSLSTDTDYVQLERSGSYIHEINVTNEGSETDTFWLTVSQSQALSPVLDAEYITLPSNASGTVNLTVSALQSAAYGYHELSIGAESVHNSERFDYLTVTVIVGKIELEVSEIKLSNKHPDEGEIVTITFEITNTGTANATDVMITVYNVTSDGKKTEIGSDLATIAPEGKVTIQKDIIYSSDFTGVSMEAKIKGKHEVWQESLTSEDLGFGPEDKDDFPLPFIVFIIILILVITIVVVTLLRKKKKD